MTNEVKEVKGVMILNTLGDFWSDRLFYNAKQAKQYLREYGYVNTNGRRFKFVTVTAKIEITGPAV